MGSVFKTVFSTAGLLLFFAAPALCQVANAGGATPTPLNTFKTISFGVNDPDLTEVPLWVNRMARLQGFDLKNTGVTEVDITGTFRELNYATLEKNLLLTDIVNLNFAYADGVTIKDHNVLTTIRSCNFHSVMDVSITDNPQLGHIGCLAQMPFVRWLRLNGNDLDNTIWTNWTGNNPKLDFVNLSGNTRLTELDDKLLNSPIKSLNISGTGISKIPAFVANLVALEMISMNYSCISKAEYMAFRLAFRKTTTSADGIKTILPEPHQYIKGSHCAD